MAIFKLKTTCDEISNTELIEASKTELDLEKHLENWLENSPWAIAQEPLIWIGRQTTASSEDKTIFPDLIDIDKDGNTVIVELKKGKAPRDVVAQLLEYAAWVADLFDDSIHELSEDYFLNHTRFKGKRLEDIFIETFETDEFPPLNQNQRLFVVAEQIPSTVSRVCRFLRMSHGFDVNCIKFSIYQTESGETLVSSESIVGQEEVVPPKRTITSRWSGDIPVKQVVWETVRELTQGDKNYIFSPKDIIQVVLKNIQTSINQQ